MAGDGLISAQRQHSIQSLLAAGDYEAVLARCRKLRQPQSFDPDLDYLYALACVGAGHPADAVVALAAVVEASPEHAGALCAMGTALQALGRDDEAIGYLDLATRLHPLSLRPWVTLGSALLNNARNDEALAAFRRAVACEPTDERAWIGLGAAAQACLAFEEAESAYRKAMSLAPDSTAALGNLGTLLVESGRQREAQACLRVAVECQPDDSVLISNRLYASLYDESATPDAIVALHRRLGGRLGGGQRHSSTFADRDRLSDRPLTVGYLSPDFRRHPIGYFMHDVLPNHDPDSVRVVGLYDNTRSDWLTEHLRANIAEWHDVAGLTDEALAVMIATLGIDILVDLAGHMQANRLPVFASRVAPVQVGWAGYPGTTGVPEMDAILVDPFIAAGAAPGDYLESVVTDLPVYACYAPPPYAPEPADKPRGDHYGLTFGTFANAAKINGRVVACWSQILARSPGAQMLIKTHACADASVRARLMAMFDQCGIAGDRLSLNGPSTHDLLLSRLTKVDIVLDTFPYSGSTSVMEALWMGVPVVTLAGRLYHERHGGAVLHAAGLDMLIAESEQDYIDIALALAHDHTGRALLRRELRGLMTRSPLRDGPRMARALEDIYRRLWGNWCDNNRPTHQV